MVQKAVVDEGDEELRSGRMRVAGAGNGNGVAGVLQAVVGLVVYRRIGALGLHARLETAALHHEAVNHPVKEGVVVAALVHIGEEVLDRLGRLGGVKLQRDDTVTGDVQFDLGVAHGRGSSEKITAPGWRSRW